MLAVNEITAEDERFSGTPSVSAGRMVVRSSKNLYCIADSIGVAKTHDELDPADLRQPNVVPYDAPMAGNGKVLQRDIAKEQFQNDAANANRQSATFSTDGKPERPQRSIPAED